jgi:hypothetical protein
MSIPQEKNTFWSWNFQAAIFKLKCIFQNPGPIQLEHINSGLFKSFALPIKPYFPYHTPCLTQVCFPVYHPVYANCRYIDLQHCQKCNIIHWWPVCPNPCISKFDTLGSWALSLHGLVRSVLVLNNQLGSHLFFALASLPVRYHIVLIKILLTLAIEL